MGRQRKPSGHGKRYFDFGKSFLYENTQGPNTTGRELPPEFHLDKGCRVVYLDTGEAVLHPLRVSEAAGYVIRRVMDDVFDVPAIDEATGKPQEEWEWRACRVIASREV